MPIIPPTPPLVAKLLDNAEKAGVNFATDSVIDPACGRGDFLAPIALRMLKKMPLASAEWTLRKISSRLRGIEIDPFAAWMTSVLLEAALMPLCNQGIDPLNSGFAAPFTIIIFSMILTVFSAFSRYSKIAATGFLIFF